MNPIALVLAVSLIANLGIGYAYLGQRDQTTAATKDRDSARGAAQSCSDSVDALQIRAADRAVKAKKDIAAAAARARSADERADLVLATPASTPGDACKSADTRATQWLKARK